jgi:uncharacterized protein
MKGAATTNGTGMRTLSLALAAAFLLSQPASADVKAGVDAWARGDFRAAVDEWRGPAVAGDPDAQFNLAQAYKLGRGVPLDPVLAESWFRKAALQNHAQAEENYGLALFQAGKKADAVPWLEKGVARGEPRTQLVLGTMLFNGDGVARDYPRAYALMTLASQKGLKSAGETLAQMDRYVSASDRERGLVLAREYASRPAAPPPGSKVASSTVTPTPAPAATPESAPAKPAPRPTATPAAKPTPKSTPKPAPAAAPATPARTGAWRVQLGAFRDRGNAEALWSRVRGKLPGSRPDYVGGGGVTRLQATGFANRADAQRACARAGVACVVVAP